MSLYSFQLNQTPYSRPKYGSRNIITESPIPASSFYATPQSSHHQSHGPSSSDTPQTSSHISPHKSLKSPSRPGKRKSDFKNTFVNFSLAHPHTTKRQKQKLTTLQKLESVLKHIQSLNWSYSDYLYWSSKWKEFDRGNTHSTAMEQFLSGQCEHHAGEIIENWYTSPDGRLGNNQKHKHQMWTTSTPKYSEIKNAKRAVKPENGLHIQLTAKSDSGALKNPIQSEWKDIGANTVSQVRTSDVGDIAAKKTRPIDIAVTHSIAAFNFCLNRQANWLPVARGILYFSSSAPVDLFAYESHIGTMPAYGTIYRVLCELGFAEGLATELAGKNLNAGNERANVTVDFFFDLINHKHLEMVGMIQWLESLVTHVPELTHLCNHVSMLYETRAAVNCVPPVPSKIYLLASNGKNENIMPELYGALLDFFAQAGQMKNGFLRQLWPFGGDGLTYQQLLELKHYLQYNENELLSLGILQPLLEWWHMMWTDLCWIYETHWGEPLSKDPSTLGHSARKIGHEDPLNLKKIDYYPGIQFSYLVLDVRMLDCWQLAFKTEDIFSYFRKLKTAGQIPPVEQLETMAVALYRCYSSTRGFYHAMNDADLPKES
ncbi:hypothetical protein EV368DRAFT_86292 [Lentinula lateritia]|nr:hypothetical protein EV368DRAFT_86292 [Lentinula lateritia]